MALSEREAEIVGAKLEGYEQARRMFDVPMTRAMPTIADLMRFVKPRHQQTGPGTRRLRHERVLRPCKTYRPGGDAEHARFSRQIDAGSLKWENGLRRRDALLP